MKKVLYPRAHDTNGYTNFFVFTQQCDSSPHVICRILTDYFICKDERERERESYTCTLMVDIFSEM